MDYEKAYKDLMRDIDIAIEGQNNGETKVVLQNIKERNIESEDERIRESLVDYFRKFKPQDMWDEMFSIGDVISYLKKQKEQKPAEWRPFDKEVLTKIKELIDSHFSEHEQREVYKDWLDEHISQPAEWSEEDEQWLESIIKDYEDSLVKDKDHAAVIKIKIDFLKSLRSQPHWKPSEEQIQVFKQTLTNFIEDCIAENLENATPENKDNHEGYHQACWDILYFIKQASK